MIHYQNLSGGKSAILTGITVCLGGKANATNRASNLKSLIREGAKYAISRIFFLLLIQPLKYEAHLKV